MADEEPASGNDNQLRAEITARDDEVSRLLAAKQKLKALMLSLENPPTATKNAEIKVHF